MRLFDKEAEDLFARSLTAEKARLPKTSANANLKRRKTRATGKADLPAGEYARRFTYGKRH